MVVIVLAIIIMPFFVVPRPPFLLRSKERLKCQAPSGALAHGAALPLRAGAPSTQPPMAKKATHSVRATQKGQKALPGPDAVRAQMQSLVIDSATRTKARRTLNDWHNRDPSFVVTEEAIRTWAAFHMMIPSNEKVT